VQKPRAFYLTPAHSSFCPSALACDGLLLPPASTAPRRSPMHPSDPSPSVTTHLVFTFTPLPPPHPHPHPRPHSCTLNRTHARARTRAHARAFTKETSRDETHWGPQLAPRECSVQWLPVTACAHPSTSSQSRTEGAFALLRHTECDAADAVGRSMCGAVTYSTQGP